MKKKNVFFVKGLLLALITGLILAGCSSVKVVDKNVAAEQSSVLYFDKDITVFKINGQKVGFMSGIPLIASSVQGKGSEKKPAARLQIPAGSTTIEAEYINYGKKEMTFEALPGRRYQVIIKLAGAGNTAGQSLGKALLGDFNYEWEFKDITDQK